MQLVHIRSTIIFILDILVQESHGILDLHKSRATRWRSLCEVAAFHNFYAQQFFSSNELFQRFFLSTAIDSWRWLLCLFRPGVDGKWSLIIQYIDLCRCCDPAGASMHRHRCKKRKHMEESLTFCQHSQKNGSRTIRQMWKSSSVFSSRLTHRRIIMVGRSSSISLSAGAASIIKRRERWSKTQGKILRIYSGAFILISIRTHQKNNHVSRVWDRYKKLSIIHEKITVANIK